MRRLLAATVGLVTMAAVVPSASASESVPPAAWPSTSLVQPRLEAWPNALRIFGSNRYQTAMAATLVLRGSGADDSFPYGSPDPAESAGWWGLNTCPRSVIIVAGDNPADALAANSLSDPTGNSTEPYLQRSAAADPLFFPPGGFARVDTDFAPILTTTSTRQGATQLDVATRLAAQDMSRGACALAKQAIVVGGVRAVPSTVEAELVSIGYDEVFRIAGSSRYQTARLVAESLGTAVAPGSPPRTTCVDPRTVGGAKANFYANSVVEYRESATQCRVLSRTVVLADGEAGIDALASGWWTSYWQVPIVLTDGSESLPSQSREALQTLDVDSLIVLGGTSRIPTSVVDDALNVSGAEEAIRISGEDRYDTSLAMARHFGGWWTTGQAADAEGSLVCVAASTGGTRSTPGLGWPDSLAAGPWCARMGVARSASGGPARALSPVSEGSGAISSVDGNSRVPAHSMVPVVLVPAGSPAPTSSVAAFLRDVFDPDSDWCSGTEASPGCSTPGFAVAFGGATLVTDQALALVDRAVSGGNSDGADRDAQASAPFWTTLSMAPVFHDSLGASANGDDQRVCFARGTYQRARWLVARVTNVAAFDLVDDLAYARDADGEARSPGVGRPHCVALDDSERPASVWVVSTTGGQPSPSQVEQFDRDESNRFDLTDEVAAGPPTATSGPDSVQDDSDGGTTSWTFSGVVAGVSASSRGNTSAVGSAELEISLRRGRNGAADGADVVTGELVLFTVQGTVRGNIEGEALLVAGTWKVRGSVRFANGTWNFDRGMGGFQADIDTGAAAGSSDDTVAWQIDGLD